MMEEKETLKENLKEDYNINSQNNSEKTKIIDDLPPEIKKERIVSIFCFRALRHNIFFLSVL